MAANNKFKQAKAMRQLQIDLIEEIKILAEAAVADESVHIRFKLRCSELDDIYEEFRRLHGNVVAMLSLSEDADWEAEKRIRTGFHDNYFTVKTIYTNLFSGSAEPDIKNKSSDSTHVRLPKISLPVYDGSYRNWPTFFDLFKTLIDNNDQLSSVAKFQYLLSSLSGQALALIKNIPLSSDNYATAFTTLTERYQNRRLLANACWQEIFNAPKLTNDSAGGLRTLLDTFSESLSALKNLNLPVDKWDFVLFHLLVQKLDGATIKRYELNEASTDIPSYSLLKDFLSKQCIALETVALSETTSSHKKSSFQSSGFPKVNPHGSLSLNRKNKSSFFTQSSSKNIICNCCKGNHSIYRCPSFTNKSLTDRVQMVKENKWCENCLHSAHLAGSCSSKSTCRLCHIKGHHTLLHPSDPDHIIQRVDQSQAESPSNSHSYVGQIRSFSNHLSNSTVLLCTALIEVCDARGLYQPVRVIIDCGSQINIISQRCVKRLGLKPSSTSLSIFGLGQKCSSASSGVSCTIRPKGLISPTFQIDAVVLPQICSEMPNSFVPVEHWKHITNIKLADPRFNHPGPIDMLLGCDLFPLILRGGKLSGEVNQPTAINTAFGWILAGKVDCDPPSPKVNSLLISLYSSIDPVLRRFWEIEEMPTVPVSSPDDILCEESFLRMHCREPSGRYSVALPFKRPEPEFQDSRSSAMRQFYSLERRLLRDESIYGTYCDIMRDYLAQGQMELITTPPENYSKTFYIPHHLVVNSGSRTSKYRIVFNASSKDSKGLSLNDTLLVGPKLQKDVVTLLLHFRLHKIVFTADIKQMYRQINVNSYHRDFQRILFRFSQEGEVQEYRLNTVTFGVSSSPFLALRTLLQLTIDEGSNFPQAADVIRSDTFVDDIVTGVATLQEAIKLRTQLNSLLEKAKFSLRKWASNSPDFLATVPEELRQQQSLSFSSDTDPVVKILGLKWQPSLDIFSYSVNPIERPCTKRTILSELAKVFDPLGFLSPVIFLGKYLMQHLWTLGLEWDQSPPSDVIALWNQFRSELPSLTEIQISRHCIPDSFLTCQLQGFCDSSERGYAAVIYLRFRLPDNSFSISLICSKTKVAPIKRISLPRLELCAALLLAKLISFVVTVYSDRLTFNEIFAWSDSTVALSWIRSSPHRFKTFVSNRISEIQTLVSPSCWRHVSSVENPADCASRGLTPAKLLNHPLWFRGPSWLQQPQDCWPKNSLNVSECSDDSFHAERRKIVLCNVLETQNFEYLLDRFSSLSKIKRIVAYCLRFIQNSQNSMYKVTGAFTSQELHEALLLLVKQVQDSSFSKLIENLRNGKPVPRAFRKLSIFFGNRGVLRVGGRLTHSGLLYDQKHPVLLPRKHRLTELIIEEVHKEHLHPGLQTLHFLLMQNFWILSPRRAIRHILSKCVRCFRVRPTPVQPPMGNLPSVRINEVKPFQYVGVDFGGPFYITLTKSRGSKSQKAYLCLFICFATKAIHLELASDMTSECFLAALRRFIARRGRCTNIFSDQGTNFVGAAKELSNLMKEATESEKISWSFNPPSAPHFGGLWEAGIKSAKSHLLRVIGHQILSYEELYTVLVQIESILNSRPLCPLSSDCHDLSVLTPGHFLVLEPLTCAPDPDLSSLSMNRLSRWQLLQRLQQDFWRRWHNEYLNTLQQRNKWWHSDVSPQIAPGTLVVIKDDLCPPLKWRLGRIDRLHPGKDGICRVATVRTVQGFTQRPLVKLCPLPIY